MREFYLNTDRGKLSIGLLRANPQGAWPEPFGALQRDPQGVAWVALIPQLTEEELKQALAGYTKPLLSKMPRTPTELLHKVPNTGRLCSQRATCILHIKERCKSGSKHMPTCYSPDGLSPVAAQAATMLLQCWWNNQYVVVAVEDAAHGH